MTRRRESRTEGAVTGRFAGETVIVTGSTRGIGAGIAERSRNGESDSPSTVRPSETG